MPGYTDRQCQTNINDCISQPCANNGSCTDEVNTFSCSCRPGYTGMDCSVNIDDCVQDACENGGTCIDEHW